MTNGEAVNWLINLTADIGKAEHRDLWHYEQALYEIKEMLEQDLHNDLHNAWQYHPADDPPENDRYVLLNLKICAPCVGNYVDEKWMLDDETEPILEVLGWWELPERPEEDT